MANTMVNSATDDLCSCQIVFIAINNGLLLIDNGGLIIINIDDSELISILPKIKHDD